MSEFNLLGSLPEVTRDVTSRLKNKKLYRQKAGTFGFDYFDGARETGYGGYHYDGRWIQVAERAIHKYNLQAGMRVLDIGCAKGFFIHDLQETCPGLIAYGVDISDYAIENCHEGIKEQVQVSNALELPFPDEFFDAVFAINTFHNLDKKDCLQAISEMNRVVKNPKNCFIQVDAYRNEDELELFEAWMLTAKTYCKPQEWLSLFDNANYQGDYFWTILDFNMTNLSKI